MVFFAWLISISSVVVFCQNDPLKNLDLLKAKVLARADMYYDDDADRTNDVLEVEFEDERVVGYCRDLGGVMSGEKCKIKRKEFWELKDIHNIDEEYNTTAQTIMRDKVHLKSMTPWLHTDKAKSLVPYELKDGALMKKCDGEMLTGNRKLINNKGYFKGQEKSTDKSFNLYACINSSDNSAEYNLKLDGGYLVGKSGPGNDGVTDFSIINEGQGVQEIYTCKRSIVKKDNRIALNKIFKSKDDAEETNLECSVVNKEVCEAAADYIKQCGSCSTASVVLSKLITKLNDTASKSSLKQANNIISQSSEVVFNYTSDGNSSRKDKLKAAKTIFGGESRRPLIARAERQENENPEISVLKNIEVANLDPLGDAFKDSLFVYTRGCAYYGLGDYAHGIGTKLEISDKAPQTPANKGKESSRNRSRRQ